MAAVDSRMRFTNHGLPENEDTWQDCQLSRIDERLEGMGSASLVDSSPTHYSNYSYPTNRHPPNNCYWHSHSTPTIPSQPEVHQLGSDSSNVPYVADVPMSNRDMYGNPYYTPVWDTPNLNITDHLNGYNNNNNATQSKNEEHEQNSVINAIRSDMAKLREQMVVRRDTENALQHILTQKEQEIERLKEELESSRSQRVAEEKKPGPLSIQFNIANPVEKQDVDKSRLKNQRGSVQQRQNRSECLENVGGQTTSVYQSVSDNSHLRCSHVDESISQYSGTTPAVDLEAQVLCLMRELDSRVVESAQAKQDAIILQRRFEKMSDKVMILNTQVQQLHTMLALQQDQNQDTLHNLHTATQELTQRDAELEDVAYLVCQIGRQVGMSLPNDAQNLQQICLSLDALSSVLSTWTPYTQPPLPLSPTLQKNSPCPQPKSQPPTLPNLKPPLANKNQLQGLKALLVLNSLLYGVHIKQDQQCMDISNQGRQSKKLQGRQSQKVQGRQYNEDEVVQKRWFRNLGDASLLKCMGNQSKEEADDDEEEGKIEGKKLRAAKKGGNQKQEEEDEVDEVELRSYYVHESMRIGSSVSMPSLELGSLEERIKTQRRTESDNAPTQFIENEKFASHQFGTQTPKQLQINLDWKRRNSEKEEELVNENLQYQQQQPNKHRSYLSRLGCSLAAFPRFLRSAKCITQIDTNSSPNPHPDSAPSTPKRLNYY